MPRWPRLLIALLFATSLALRAWVPAGWMPTPGAHSLAIMPCPAADMPMMADMGHGHRHHSGTDNDCFSPLMAGAALPDPPPRLPPAAAPPPHQQASLEPPVFAGGPAASPPPSTGPPPLA